MSSYDVGPDHRLTLPGLLRQFHDVAQEHAAAHHFGYRELSAGRRAWALVCIDLELTGALPLGQTAFGVDTAVARSRGPVVYRDYRALAEGFAFARAQSMWTVIDLDTRRATSPSPKLRDTIDDLATDHLRGPQTRRQRPGSPLAVHAHRTVHFHDCDFNGHLNNVAAVQWLLDAAYEVLPRPQTGRSSATPYSLALKRLHVSYHTEALTGERLGIGASRGAETGPTSLDLELRGSDGRPVVTAQVVLDAGA